MKKFAAVFSLFACLFIAGAVKAQTPDPTPTPTKTVVYDPTAYDNHTRFLLGMNGGGDFGNLFLSFNAGLEVPIGNRLEIDLGDGFSPVFHVDGITIPFESHINLGTGSANIASGGAIIWVSPGKSLGLSGTVDYSAYSTSIHKGGYYVHSDLVWRKVAWQMPTRFSFGYFQQFQNGIACGNIAACSLPGANGTETNHVKGGEFGMVTRMGAIGPTVIRMTFSTNVGHLLTQGNQFCDGTLGIYVPSCKRGSAVSGGATMGVMFEFPRHRGLEYNNPF